ncbi:MAG: hypothetical protein V1800_12280 [Candidatus Latescibacterota bacterium]
MGTVFEVSPGQRQLFLDAFAVSRMERLSRTMHQPEKRGAVLTPDIPSDGTMVQTRSAPMWVPDEGVYKLVYLAYTMDNPAMVGPALAVSKDGICWEKSDLGQMTLYGSRKNNRIVVDPALTWPASCLECVEYDPDDADPSRRYKGLFGAEGRRPIVSPDCIHWRVLDVPNIPSGDEGTLTYDRPNRRFLAPVKGGNPYGRAFNISLSEDFLHWTEPRFLFGADAEDQPMAAEAIRQRLADPGLANPLFVDPDPETGWMPSEGKPHHPTWRAECYNVGLFPYEGLYIGWPMMYHPTGTDGEGTNTDGFDLIKLIASRDLMHWEWLGDREPFIGPSRTDNALVGVWDRIQLAITNRPVVRGDELWFYYSGMKWRDNIYASYPDGSKRSPDSLTVEERADLEEGWGAICLAVLRRDGFISLDAGADEGMLETRPFVWTGEGLYVNCEASKGEVCAQVVDSEGKEIALSEPVTGDLLRGRIHWSEGNPSAARGQVVSLRFRLRNARLYSYWLEN